MSGLRAGFDIAVLRESKAIYTLSRKVRFQEVDAAGIVFFARFLAWFHDVEIDCLESAGQAHADATRAGTWTAPLVHAEADYVAPLRYGDAYEVALVQARVGQTSYRLGFRVTGPAGLHATGELVHVVVDPATLRPIDVPPALRATLEGEPKPTQ